MKNLVRHYRKEMKLTQEGLAKIAGITRHTVHEIERGDYRPSLLLAFKLSIIFGCSKIEEIFLIDKKNVFNENELEELKNMSIKLSKKSP